MSEKRILIASLLKPINDTRLYEKLGVTISKLPGSYVHICAYEAPIPENAPHNISFHPIFSFKRLSLGRAKAQYDYYQLLLQVKPELIIVSTHELLLVSYLYKQKYKCDLVYDVQENYSLNLRAQHNYSQGLKHLMAFGVRGFEKLTANGIDHFLLAERSYAEELPFVQGRYTFIENKYKAPSNQIIPDTPVAIPTEGPLRLLYSGTIAEEYGVWEAIALVERLHALNTAVQLTIIGYCANAQTWDRLQAACQKLPFVELIGGDRLVPHRLILEKMGESHIGLLPYRPNASTFRCIPTKHYEYMAHALPTLIQQNPLWQGIVEGSGAGLSIDFRTVDVPVLYKQLLSMRFYAQGIPDDIFWQSEEEKLLALVQDLLTK
ncbi:glycosyltransferase [uncultured Pontibacter sp.]|uniref:glycosyltransferase n=1 Tax=uncultured Pontibacter sp. TaxID=453356 RepID=UPI00261D81B6|nr:glycosyltransferase [uncultured Pontibacter sp.]